MEIQPYAMDIQPVPTRLGFTEPKFLVFGFGFGFIFRTRTILGLGWVFGHTASNPAQKAKILSEPNPRLNLIENEK